MKLINLISAYTPHYQIFTDEKATYILLFEPYKPFEKFPLGYAKIDSYYIHSNNLFKLKKQLEKELVDYGAKETVVPYQKLFSESGTGIYLKNKLIMIPPFGTRVVLNVIELEKQKTLKYNQAQKIYGQKEKEAYLKTCEDCNKCAKACPSGALGINRYEPARCLRGLMDQPQENFNRLIELKAQFLGCEVCQDVCPFNSDIGLEIIPNELLKELEFRRFEENINSGKQALKTWAKYIGDNYNRPKKLYYLLKVSQHINLLYNSCE